MVESLLLPVATELFSEVLELQEKIITAIDATKGKKGLFILVKLIKGLMQMS